MAAFLDTLLKATNAHDIDGIVACFAEGYVNHTPTHPLRGFVGTDQVRLNWTGMITAVPDLTVTLLSSACPDDTTIWSEWEMLGTRADGQRHHLCGVIIFTVEHQVATRCRFYLEPVDQ